MANDYMDHFTINGTEVVLQDYGRDQPNGVPVLDSQGKLSTKYIPDNFTDADKLLVSPEDPYKDNFVAWAEKLASPEFRNAGKSWTQGTGGNTTYSLLYVAYANGLWVCGSIGHGMWWSEDGKSWTQGTGDTTVDTYRATYANGLWVCGSSRRGMLWSGVSVYLPEIS